ncbi:IS630 family transposase, partial [Bacillus thuringiensis]
AKQLHVFYSSIYEIQRNVQTFIQELNRTPEKVIDRLCVQL